MGATCCWPPLTDRELTLYMCRCRLPPAAADLAAGDFTEMRLGTVRARRGGEAPSAFSYTNRFCMARLHGRAGRLTVKNGGFRPGQWGSPAHGQTWGQRHGCADPTRVGPPESEPAGCGGEYRYFPGEAFGTDAAWDWSAPFTADYVLRGADGARGFRGSHGTPSHPADPLDPPRHELSIFSLQNMKAVFLCLLADAVLND